MKNRAAQHARRRKRAFEEKLQLRSVFGYNDPTAYKAMQNVLRSKEYKKILAN